MDFILVKLNKREEIDAKLNGVIKNVKSLEVKSLNVELQKKNKGYARKQNQ